ncbi:MAG: hypothetical protein AAGF04_03365 [Chlamydiota bacterium]
MSTSQSRTVGSATGSEVKKKSIKKNQEHKSPHIFLYFMPTVQEVQEFLVAGNI